jgi:hypothetical protein
MTPFRLSIAFVLVSVSVALAAYYVSPMAAGLLALAALSPFTPRVALRFLSSLFILIGLIALVADLTPVTSGSGSFVATPLGDHWLDLLPASYQAAKVAVARSSQPWLWEGPIALVLAVPTFVLFGMLALVFGFAGRRRREVEIFVN